MVTRKVGTMNTFYSYTDGIEEVCPMTGTSLFHKYNFSPVKDFPLRRKFWFSAQDGYSGPFSKRPKPIKSTLRLGEL